MEDPKTEIPDPVFDPPNQKAQVKPVMLSHGTMECYDLKETRRFYEEFLGLECVRQGPRAIFVRCGMKFHIVCRQATGKLHPSNLYQHWGFELRSRAEVDDALRKVRAFKDEYKIRQVFDPDLQHGVYSFYFEDLDHNWWEYQYYDGFQHDDAFDFGDRFGQEEKKAAPAS